MLVSLLGNLLTGKRKFRVGEGIIRADEGVVRAVQDYKCFIDTYKCSSFNKFWNIATLSKRS